MFDAYHMKGCVIDIEHQSLLYDVPEIGLVTCAHFTDDLTLLNICDNNKIYLFDIKLKDFHIWTKKTLKKLPLNYLSRFNRIYGCVQLGEHEVMLYSHYSMIYIDFSAEVPSSCKIDNTKHRVICSNQSNEGWIAAIKDHQRECTSLCTVTKGPERKLSTINSNFSIIGAYSGIIGVQLIGQSKIQIVETRWAAIVSKFPGVASYKKYGN